MDFLKTYDVFIAYHGSYDLNGSKKYADQIYLIDHKIICSGTPAEVLDSHSFHQVFHRKGDI